MLIFKLLLLSLISLTTTDLRVLFFTMESCPPCKQTEPGIDQLRTEGVAVSKIDIRQYQQYAQQCRVNQTPTVLIVDGDKVLARHTGAISYADLRQMLNASNAKVASAEVAHQPVTELAMPAATAAQLVSTNPPVSTNPDVETGPAIRLTPEQRAFRATVRFRVEDSQGVSYATGTIVHRQGNEALVLTCGHVFRESNGKGKINSDIGFAFGEPNTVIGKLLYYDAKHHDIALVAIPCPYPIEPVSVGPESMNVSTGDRIFSLGCDRGATPTVRNSVLKAVTTYSGVAKYDIVGRPVDGRSGGGLFSAGGQLIGVCNAAAVDVDEGIYTGLQSVYWQFAITNLTHLFKRSAVPGQLTFEPETQVAENRGLEGSGSLASSPGQLQHPATRTATVDPTNALPANQVVARGDELNPPVVAAVFRGGAVPVNNAVYRGNGVPVRTAAATAQTGQPTSDMEMIVIVRSKSDPGMTQTITIPNPDSETIQWIRDSERRNQSSQAVDSTMAKRMARLPDLQPPGNLGNRQQMRSQSPR